MGDRLKAYGIGLWDLAVLAALRDFGPASQGDLGIRLGIDPSDLVAVMDTLAPRGLIERSRGPPGPAALLGDHYSGGRRPA
ncbi:hypothetical protein GCM10027187_73120 [Streptosporangium sandarakinum]